MPTQTAAVWHTFLKNLTQWFWYFDHDYVVVSYTRWWMWRMVVNERGTVVDEDGECVLMMSLLLLLPKKAAEEEMREKERERRKRRRSRCLFCVEECRGADERREKESERKQKRGTTRRLSSESTSKRAEYERICEEGVWPVLNSLSFELAATSSAAADKRHLEVGNSIDFSHRHSFPIWFKFIHEPT